MVATFMHKILRIVLKIYLPQRETNEEVRRRAEMEKRHCNQAKKVEMVGACIKNG